MVEQPAPTTNDGSLNYVNWERLLPIKDPKRLILLRGIKEGFSILDCTRAHSSILANIEVENYSSATSYENNRKYIVEKQIKDELQNGRYCVVASKPLITSAIGAIDKGNSKVRLIHDASRPYGVAVNDFCQKEPFSYTSLQDAVNLVTPDCYLAKVDLSNAYRSVRVHPSNLPFLGLKWVFEGQTQPTYMVDQRLPFGGRRSPFIFNELTQAVVRIMENLGYTGIVVYLDDFLVVQKDQDRCRQTLNALIHVLRLLGFSVNYSKVAGPTQFLQFLGIDLNTKDMKISLPQNKIADLKHELLKLKSKNKASKKELQALAGRMNFAAQCIYGGRVFMRRIHDEIAKLRRPWHRIRISATVRADLEWWNSFMQVFNGTLDIIDPRPLTPVSTDACTVAGGATYDNEYIYLPWATWDGTESLHINVKELLACELALHGWAEKLRGHKVLIHSDNQAAVGMLNHGSTKNKEAMECLRRIFWITAVNNIRVVAYYVKGSRNIAADAASRLHEGGHMRERLSLDNDCFCHMHFREHTDKCGSQPGLRGGTNEIIHLRGCHKANLPCA